MADTADFESLLSEVHSALVTSGSVQAVTDQFSRLDTDMERVRFVLRMAESAPLQRVAVRGPPQSAAASEKLRADGNACFGRGEHSTALRLYSLAAQCAPPTSPQLSLALANRSAALFKLGNYGPCEEAILLALQHGYPAELRYKLHERLGEARRRRGDSVAAEKAFCAALKGTPRAALDAGRRKQLLKRLEGLVCRSAADRVIRLLETGQEDGQEQGQQQQQRHTQGQHERGKKNGQTERTQELETAQGERREEGRSTRPSALPPVTPLPSLSHGASSVLPSASAAVDLVMSEDKDRMLVANRDLSPG